MGAIELSETVGVAREMSGSPIEDDSDSGIVAAVDEIHEVRGRAIAAGGRGRAIAAGGSVIAQRLVAPGAVEGMLHDGQQFDVGVAEVSYVRDKLIAEFSVG